MNGTTTKNVAPYIVAAIVSVFLIIIAYVMFFVPKMDESKRLVSQAATAHANNAALTAKADRLAAIAQNLDPLKTQVGEFTQAFPSEARQQEMIDAINEAAGSTGVTLKALSPNVPAPATDEAAEEAAPAPADPGQQAGTELPGPAPVPGAGQQAAATAPAEQLGKVTLKVDAEGSLEAVRAFIVKVENLKRPLLVHEVQIEKLEKSYHVTLNGETFLTAPLVEPKGSGDSAKEGSLPEATEESE